MEGPRPKPPSPHPHSRRLSSAQPSKFLKRKNQKITLRAFEALQILGRADATEIHIAAFDGFPRIQEKNYKTIIEYMNSIVTLRLFVDTRSNKVLFVEAQKYFTNFIFSLLTLPLGLVTKLLSPLIMIGSIGNLYKSIEDLNQTHFIVNRNKSSLLQPKLLISDLASPLFLGMKVIKESAGGEDSPNRNERGTCFA